MLMKFLW